MLRGQVARDAERDALVLSCIAEFQYSTSCRLTSLYFTVKFAKQLSYR